MQVEKRHIFLHLKFYSHPSIRLASASLQSVFLDKKRVFEIGTLKNQTCTHPSLVQHEKLTPYAKFHALPQKRRVLFFYSFKRRDYITADDLRNTAQLYHWKIELCFVRTLSFRILSTKWGGRKLDACWEKQNALLKGQPVAPRARGRMQQCQHSKI